MTGAPAFFLPSLAGGGAERVVVDLVNGLTRRGLAVELVLGDHSGPLVDRVDDDVTVVDLGVRRASRVVPRLAGWMARRRPRAVVSALEHTNVAALVAGAAARTRVVPSVHNMVSPLFSSPHRSTRAAAWAATAAYRRAAEVVAVSAAVGDDLVASMGVDPRRIRVVPNPVDAARVQRLARDGEDRSGDRARPRLVALGRLERVKGFDLLLPAWARVRATRGGHLTIFGEGSERAALERQAAELQLGDDALTFAGFDDNPWPTVAASDGLVVSSRDEGFGLTLVEAMALGIPVATTCGDGAPGEIVDRGRFGEVATTGSVASLADAMLRLVDAPRPPGELVARARRWSPDRAMQTWAELLGLTAA